MNLFDVIILGVLQGLTEFLPISSSAHLVISQYLLGIQIPGNALEVILHVGTLFSVVAVFRKDIISLLSTLKESETQKYIFYIIIGTLPAVVVGLLFKEKIESAFDSVTLVAVMLLATGVILILTKWVKNRKKELNSGNGLLIGMAQALAIIPGLSRSGLTISMGLFLGIPAEVVARFSFLLAIPAIAGAGLLTTLDLIGTDVTILSIPLVLTGFISSFIVGWVALKWLIGLLKTGKFHWFGVYCVGVGILIWIVK